MSDEETDNESNGFTVHKLSWRSNVLNRLLSRLDGRYDESRKNSTICTKPREQRKLGEFSDRTKPFGAPQWTLMEPQDAESPITPPTCDGRRQASHNPEIYGHSSDLASTPCYSMEPVQRRNDRTPNSAPSHSLQPAQLFQEWDEEYVSDEELDTLIRAATMRL